MALSKIGTPGLESSISTNLTGTVNGYTPTESNMAGRNRIINGDMRINQRAWSSDAIESGYTLDRWVTFIGVSNTWSVSQNAGSVTPPSGFTNYLGVTSLAATTPASGHRNLVCQMIEGYNIADLAWGYATAKPVTLSFWVRSSLTGTFGAAIDSTGQETSATFSYTIDSANTWEYKTITIAGPTTNPAYWNDTNGRGLWLFFDMGTGEDYAQDTTWGSSYKYTIGSSRTNVIGTNGATWYITGVQLEAGSVATPFEHRQYGQELALCQRYFQAWRAGWNGVSASSGYQYSATVNFSVTSRVSPTIAVTSYSTGSRFPQGSWFPTNVGTEGFIAVCTANAAGGNDNWIAVGTASAEL